MALAQNLMEIKEKPLQDDAKAQANLGDMYDTGKGMKQDFLQAKLWYEKAAAQGHGGAKEMLQKMASDPRSSPLQPPTPTSLPGPPDMPD
jgi:TPR repeat protein